jgi:DNA-binding NtrC family response regulator
LVVDDEEPIRQIVASMLSFANYESTEAESGRDALRILYSGLEFDLMLSDLMTADLDGIGLLEIVRRSYPDIATVVISAVHDASVALAALRNGAYDYHGFPSQCPKNCYGSSTTR